MDDLQFGFVMAAEAATNVEIPGISSWDYQEEENESRRNIQGDLGPGLFPPRSGKVGYTLPGNRNTGQGI